MKCQDCHGAAEMHASAESYDHRLEVLEGPTCESCHADVMDANEHHLTHWGDLQCQVCHSQDYKSCNRCHAGEGLEEPSYMSFKIGRNPVPDLRPYTYVLLRHIPVAPDTYREWGVTELASFDVLPTWKYTAPHNVKRWTDRTLVAEGADCGDACHGTPDESGFFLRQADLDASPEEADANRHLIVPDGSPESW
jgi:thiosulfate/3-mercaptopyruvate sulfurtransferase